MTMRKIFGLILFMFSLGAVACPEGQQPAGNPTAGNPSGCVPYPNNHLQQSQARKVVLDIRWGAVSIDATSGKLGAATGARSKKQAQKAAASQCRANGGSKCVIDIVYYNQCAVMILGDKKYNTESPAQQAIISGVKRLL